MIQLNTVYNENCLDTMARMPEGFIDLTVTSPPYDNLRTYNGYSFDFESIAKELYRVTKTGGVVVWVVGDATINGSETLTSFKQALYFKEIGFNVHDTMIYQRKTKPLTHNRYEQEFEYMFVFSKGRHNTINHILIPCVSKGEKRDKAAHRTAEGEAQKRWSLDTVKAQKIKGNVWQYHVGHDQSTRDAIAHKHPAIFPEQLAHDHIYSWSNEGDIVYDCFGGSGTTAKMARQLNRNYILSEISAEYCKIIEQRLFMPQLKLIA